MVLKTPKTPFLYFNLSLVYKNLLDNFHGYPFQLLRVPLSLKCVMWSQSFGGGCGGFGGFGGLWGSELERVRSVWSKTEPGKEGNLCSKCQKLLLSKVRRFGFYGTK